MERVKRNVQFLQWGTGLKRQHTISWQKSFCPSCKRRFKDWIIIVNNLNRPCLLPVYLPQNCLPVSSNYKKSKKRSPGLIILDLVNALSPKQNYTALNNTLKNSFAAKALPFSERLGYECCNGLNSKTFHFILCCSHCLLVLLTNLEGMVTTINQMQLAQRLHLFANSFQLI